MQTGVGLLVTDVMPIYMIIPRYSHNYAQFYQLLDSNLFTHRNTYTILREATSETYGPRVYLPSYYYPINLLFLFCNHYFPIYTTKIPKIFILLLLSLSDLTLVSDREGIDNPFITLVARLFFVCVCTRDLRVVSYWIDTLVLKNWGYLRYFAASPFPLQRKTNACSRGSKKDFWRRCQGGLRSSQDIPSTHHKLLSLALHYLPFASRFPLPHFTFAILFAPLPFVLMFAHVTMCLFFACIFAC